MVVYQTGQMLRVVSHRVLFVLYVNDIPDIIEGGIRMFADDTKIYSVIKNCDNCLRLQQDYHNGSLSF